MYVKGVQKVQNLWLWVASVDATNKLTHISLV